MKRLAIAALVLAAASPIAAQEAQDVQLKDLKSRRSYAIGLNVGRNIKGDGLELDLKTLVAGIRDAMTGANPKLTDAELNEVMLGLEQEMVRQAQAPLGGPHVEVLVAELEQHDAEHDRIRRPDGVAVGNHAGRQITAT